MRQQQNTLSYLPGLVLPRPCAAPVQPKTLPLRDRVPAHIHIPWIQIRTGWRLAQSHLSPGDSYRDLYRLS